MNLNSILFYSHSGVRWLVVLITVIALVWMIVGLVQRRSFDQMARRIMLAFSALVTVQWLLGLVLFLALGLFTRYHWEHAAVMTVATGAAHMHQRWKNAPDTVRYRNSLIVVVVVLALVVVGVALLPQGWQGRSL
jgi:uncharacterized membrane protein YphA (DoxX/SURF4 family)